MKNIHKANDSGGSADRWKQFEKYKGGETNQMKNWRDGKSDGWVEENEKTRPENKTETMLPAIGINEKTVSYITNKYK